MPLQRAIDLYHALLEPQIAADSQGQMEEQLRRRGLFFGERPLCTVLRPRFLTPEQYRFLRDNGCDEMQGFLFSKPIHPDAFADLLKTPDKRGFDD